MGPLESITLAAAEGRPPVDTVLRDTYASLLFVIVGLPHGVAPLYDLNVQSSRLH